MKCLKKQFRVVLRAVLSPTKHKTKHKSEGEFDGRGLAAEHLQTGRIGEEAAKKHLKQKGYKIIEQNYRTKYGEIDLIASKGKELVFVEVRTRKREDYGLPEDTINKKKLKKIWLNVKAYIAAKKWWGPCRIDAISVILKENNSIKRLNHYENII